MIWKTDLGMATPFRVSLLLLNYVLFSSPWSTSAEEGESFGSGPTVSSLGGRKISDPRLNSDSSYRHRHPDRLRLSLEAPAKPESCGPLTWLGRDPGVLEGWNTGRREFRSAEALAWLGLDPGISQAFMASAWLSGSSGPLSWLSLDPGVYYFTL